MTEWKPTERQETALLLTQEEDIFELGYGGGRGGGKRIADDEQILTDSGWKLVGDVSYDDKLVSIDGTYTNITGIFKEYSHQMYEITFDDRVSIRCDDEHLWTVKTGKHGYRDGWVVRDTRSLRSSRDSIFIPTIINPSPGINWNGPDPYILGLILGDGTLTGKHTTIYSADDEIISYLRLSGWHIYNYGRSVSMCQLLGGDESFRNILGRCIGSYKAVPSDLLDADPITRLSLLQGLMDSDGSIDKEGRCTFCSISQNLASSVQYLSRSLGGKATINIKHKISPKGGQDWYYCVNITHGGKFNPFRLTRKSVRVNRNQKGCLRTITSIKKSHPCSATCFSIDHPSNLYIVKDFIVTHNTETGLALSLYRKDDPNHRGLVIRKRSEDLKDWVDRAERFYAPFGAVKTGTPGDFRWPSGAITRTGHLNDAKAYSKYVGHNYDLMIIEELNLIPTEENYLKLTSSCRSAHPELKPLVFSNFNPSDCGFSWIKRRFNLHGIPKQPIFTVDKTTGLKRVFVPSLLKDNPYLMRDPQYRAFLDGLPDGLREAWRDGSWDEPIIKGAYYTFELAQAQRENRLTIVPYNPMLKVHTVWDLGVSDAMTIWFVQRTSDRLYIINYYENENFGLDHYIQKLQELGMKERYIYGKHFAPFDINKREQSTGKTTKDTARAMGISFSDVPMVGFTDGILKARLMFPHVYIDREKCSQGIDALRNYRKVWDENLLLYRDEPLHDWASHGADAFRYLSLVEDQMFNDVSYQTQSSSGKINLDPYAR